MLNPFHATGVFLYPLKTSENGRSSDVFRGYRKRPVDKRPLNGLMEALQFQKYLPDRFASFISKRL